MYNEKFGGAPRPNEGEDEAFKKFMESVEDTVPLEDVSFEDGEGVRLDSAIKMIERMDRALSEDSLFSSEDDKEAREMIMTLEKLQATLPEAKEIGVALVQLRHLRHKLHEETV